MSLRTASPARDPSKPKRVTLWLLWAGALLTPPLHASERRVDGADPQDREIQAEAPDRPKDMPLSLLPQPRSLDLKPPRPAAMEAIDDLLAKIVSEDKKERSRSALMLRRAKTDWVSGIQRRANRLADRADKRAMKRTFEGIRAQAKEFNSDGGESDYLSDVLAAAEPKDQAWRDLTQLLSMNRMLTAVGSADAARAIVFIYSRFGEFVRIDCQRQLDEIGARATAALIDARRHPATKIQAWAKRLLSLRKKIDAHDAVRTEDSSALAEILVALGRSRDPEVTQLLLSFAASDRSQIKQAAREGLVLLGDVGSWQLKDAYKDITGKTPPRDWTWKRTARELFTEYDRLKLEEAYALLAAAKRHLDEERYAEAILSYNKVVALVPFFQQKDQLAAGYFSAAQALKDEKPLLALDAAYRAETLFSDPKEAVRAEALRRLLQAEKLEQKGWIDQIQIERARALDPSLNEKSSQLARTQNKTPAWGTTSRYAIAITVAAVSLAAAAWIMFSTWFRGRRPKTSSSK